MISFKNGRYMTYAENGKLIEVPPIDEICEAIKVRVRHAEEREENAIKKMEEMRDEKWKDSQLTQMREELNRVKQDYYRGFPISQQEQDEIDNWEDNHWTNQHMAPDLKSRLAKMGAIGGSFKYEFIPTSIGVVGKCICSACKYKARKNAEEIVNRKDFSSQGEYEKALNTKIQHLEKKYDAEFIFQDI